MWAKWPWVRTGHPYQGVIWAMLGLSGNGLELVSHSWVLYGLSGHVLELVTHDWVLYGLFVG